MKVEAGEYLLVRDGKELRLQLNHVEARVLFKFMSELGFESMEKVGQFNVELWEPA